MITYNDIYESLRKEKYSENLQPLGKKFISEVAEYLKEKKELADKKGDMFSEAIIKTKKQLENAISIFKELMMRRKKKLLTLAFIARETGISKKDFENMLNSEKDMFDRIVKSLEDSDKKIEELLFGDKNENSNNQLVTFKEDIGEFLDMKGKKVGPFAKGDIANLPEEIVKILSAGGKVDTIEE